MTIRSTQTAICDICGAVYENPDAMLTASITVGDEWWGGRFNSRSHFCDWQCLDKWIAKKKEESRV